MAELCEYETPEGSVGKMLVSSILPEIHRCISVMYSEAGSSTGSLFLLSQVKEWFAPADMRGQEVELQMELPSSSFS